MVLKKAILIQSIFFTAAAILVLAGLALMIFVGSQGLHVFSYMNPLEFFTGTTWDQNSETYGVLPLLAGSLATALITLLISAPLAILVALFMVEVASPPVRQVMRTTVELFASLPSVIYGLLGLVIVVPWVRQSFHTGLGKGILAASIVLVFMTQPTMVAITEDTLRALPKALREGAWGLGATRWQMIWGVLLPAARPGILTAVILGMGRAIGETMAVQMVIGNITARVPKSFITGATTMPAAIVTQLPEATSPEHRAALIMVGFLLLLITFALIATVRLTTGGAGARR
ncbi:MAG: phosphate ABC transporter permease subunit PstC [Chloroflexi bacterium]|nr:phosphate ABC transporter permease subunit PstC [Chloroflexota bacterium]